MTSSRIRNILKLPRNGGADRPVGIIAFTLVAFCAATTARAQVAPSDAPAGAPAGTAAGGVADADADLREDTTGNRVAPPRAGTNMALPGEPAPLRSGVAVDRDGRPISATSRIDATGATVGATSSTTSTSAPPAASMAAPILLAPLPLTGAPGGMTSGTPTSPNAAGVSPAAPMAIGVPATLYIVAGTPVATAARTADQSADQTAHQPRSDRMDAVGADRADAGNVDEAPPSPPVVAPSALTSDAYDGRTVTLKSRVASVNGANAFTLASSNVVVVHPAPLSDSPLREDVIVTGLVRPFSLDDFPFITAEQGAALEGKRVLVADSIIQIER